MKQYLKPTLDDLRLECVLVQAWKKASKYIRRHNWYADTLELDYQSLRLPFFLREIMALLESPVWQPTPLRIVPAPKAQKWKLKEEEWIPAESIKGKLRPLAHVNLIDQVVSTAIMLCMADRIETLQGDPTLPIEKVENRKKVTSYGNRLFCDNFDGVLRHRWGSSKLYRQYFSDYQNFLRRPNVIADELNVFLSNEKEVAIVQVDLSKFYDRVRPDLLLTKIRNHSTNEATDEWFEFIKQLFNWRWHDTKWIESYSEDDQEYPINGFERVALPQGLVASGFFANVVLLDFDQQIQERLGATIRNDFIIYDYCRYVDDMRLVLTVPAATDEDKIGMVVSTWLQELLNIHARGLVIEPAKTKVTVEGRKQHFLVPQSKTAARLHNDVSGAFDMLHGTDLIGAIEGFFYTQQRYSSMHNKKVKQTGLLIGISDMRDDTAARFAAGKFRRVFRSLRPLLDDGQDILRIQKDDNDEERHDEEYPLSSLILSKQQLDERAHLFSAMLVEEWVKNPSNVRLLRIALDMYPDHEFLGKVLAILKDGWTVGGCKSHRKEVKQYCLAEIFRAGATETGIVGAEDCLPRDVDLEKYHGLLSVEARSILDEFASRGSSTNRLSWYLVQQVLLYLSARNETKDIPLPARRNHPMLSLYHNFVGFLNGEHQYEVQRRSIFSALAVSAFGNEGILEKQKLSDEFIQQLSLTAPSVAERLWSKARKRARRSHFETAKRMGLDFGSAQGEDEALPQIASRSPNPFWEEENLLLLAEKVADHLTVEDLKSPFQITCREVKSLAESSLSIPRIDPNSIEIGRQPLIWTEMFKIPDWAQEEDDRKRYKLGVVLRFALRGNVDFYHNRRPIEKSHPPRYIPPISHWEQARYGGYHGRTAFAPEWVPISSWTENLLLQLLMWPGCGIGEEPPSFDSFRKRISRRLKELQDLRLKASGLTFLEQVAPPPYKITKNNWHRPIRIGVAQSVFPDAGLFERVKNSNGSLSPTLSDPQIRAQHRQHLVTMIEGVKQMLRVRETHIENSRLDKRILDLLIFPELSIHPDDVNSILVPFVRRYRCIVLAGLIFHTENTLPGAPLINSAIWLIPEWKKHVGLHVHRIQQGKWNLTPFEKSMNPHPEPFRPAQWIINYEWQHAKEPLRLSASICYDSTDLSLASNLKLLSDIFIICAFNRDVGTFDRMAESLHYHMFQGIIIVNNGQYGGSNFYMPFEETFRRQVLHLHGQPQAQIAFIEAEPEKLICKGTRIVCDPCRLADGNDECLLEPRGKWKTPPAGWKHRNQ